MRPVANPPNPWRSQYVELLEPPPAAMPKVYEQYAKTILSANDSPDVPFRYSVNPYRGCRHGCAYCYARPTHEYLEFGAGSDFESHLVVKVNAAALLAQRLSSPRWKPEVIAFSGNTDCYQPLEAAYELTRRCLVVCYDYANPVTIITKGALVARDAELIAAIARRAAARVYVSIPFADAAPARALEPYAPSPERRLETIAKLAQAGVDVGVAVAPLIPGLNDTQIPTVLARARKAGARHCFTALLRLDATVEAVFRARVEETMPLRAGKIFAALAAARDGALTSRRFGERMTGRGPRWQAILDLYRLSARRLGYLSSSEAGITANPVAADPVDPQLRLFDS